ncbi:hypothetical protein IW261DRAFT_1576491 [Armillaria novae-zelandiae]|uniref:Uncharacterized protein n=1 Tax=Armillaria novae-zelandiae TaxID=153914 RepID=A0AA39NAQ8_9AGAR|nr:hypothetical protein IW261DRAFT_1576491 [Armillaria novae-zelandiae]
MPSHLCSNPKLLTHRAAPSLPLRPFDGLYGTILDDLDMFVITPNANTYGFDDPLQWPQAFVPDYTHYACLCWHTPEVNDPLRPLYLGVTEYDWQEIDDFAIVTSLGRMRRSTFQKLQAGCKAVIETVAGVECSAVVTANMRGHIIMLERLLARLSDLPMSYQRMHLCHAETQHIARELHALVQYMTLYKPLMDAPESNAPPMPVDDGLVGAFSNDATTVQSFFKAGIPVWRIISIKELPGVHVDNVCEFSNSPHPEEPSRLRLPTIFTGSLRDPTKYKKIHEFVTHSMRWVDPFALSSPIVKYRADMPLIEMGEVATQNDGILEGSSGTSQPKTADNALTMPPKTKEINIRPLFLQNKGCPNPHIRSAASLRKDNSLLSPHTTAKLSTSNSEDNNLQMPGGNLNKRQKNSEDQNRLNNPPPPEDDDSRERH